MKKKNELPDYLLNLFNNFLALLLFKIKILDIFNMTDFLADFCYIAKYRNSNRIKLMVENVRSIN